MEEIVLNLCKTCVSVSVFFKLFFFNYINCPFIHITSTGIRSLFFSQSLLVLGVEQFPIKIHSPAESFCFWTHSLYKKIYKPFHTKRATDWEWTFTVTVKNRLEENVRMLSQTAEKDYKGGWYTSLLHMIIDRDSAEQMCWIQIICRKYCQCEITVINRDFGPLTGACDLSLVTLITDRKSPDSGCQIMKGAVRWNSCIAIYGNSLHLLGGFK